MGRRSLLDSHFIEFASIVLFYAAAVSLIAPSLCGGLHRALLIQLPPSCLPYGAAFVAPSRGCVVFPSCLPFSASRIAPSHLNFFESLFPLWASPVVLYYLSFFDHPFRF
jgi:hypothetical protein